jgi:plasmid maintenance system antidote protein VapI
MPALTPAQFRTALDRLGISQAGCARVLDINRRTVTRYLSGDLEVPPLVAWALKGLQSETRRIREDA